MGNNSYYKPDFRRLNREAERTDSGGSEGPAEKFMARLFPNSGKAGPIRHDPELFGRLSEAISETREKINWGQDLQSASYVVFDTETTGFYPYRGDEIISIGAVMVENGRILDESSFYRLVNPGRPVPGTAQKITGITEEMLKDKPDIGPVLLEFLSFCRSRILVAHNAPFDLAFINIKLGEAIGKRIVNPVIDTVLLTSALFYQVTDYSLENLAAHFDLDLQGRHNALGDARITASLFLKLLPVLEAKGVTDLSKLAGLFTDMDPAKGYPLIF